MLRDKSYPHQTKTTEIMYWLCQTCYDETLLGKRKIRLIKSLKNLQNIIYLSCGKCGKPTLNIATYKVAITYPQNKNGMPLGRPKKERKWLFNNNYIIVCPDCLEIEWVKLKLKNKNPYISTQLPSNADSPWSCNNCKKKFNLLGLFNGITITY